jgi:hypothetical protein
MLFDLSENMQLAQFIPGIPACPPKRVFNSQSAEQFEKARQEHLLWLQQVLRIPAAAQSKQVHDFLTTEANVSRRFVSNLFITPNMPVLEISVDAPTWDTPRDCFAAWRWYAASS